MTSPIDVYQQYLGNKTRPYYDWIESVVEHLEEDETGQEYLTINPRFFIVNISRNKPHKKLTVINLYRTLASAMEKARLKEGWGEDFFKSGSGNGGIVYHFRTSTVLPALKKI